MENILKENIIFNSPSAISVVDSDITESFPPHWHNAAEFTLMKKDGCRYCVNGVLYEMNAGDILLVWPQQIHETVKIPKDGALFIQFSSGILENNLDLVSISRFLYEIHHISADKEPALTGFISDRLHEIKKIHNSSGPLTETGCKLCIYEILLKIGEYAVGENSGIDPEKDDGRSWQYIHAACTYILDNHAEPITQAETAKHIGLSTYYFSKLFKQYMHMSFPAYLADIRVKSAAGLLLDKKRSITECAFMAGFQSTTAFNKTFHEITGYSPRDFRKLYR